MTALELQEIIERENRRLVQFYREGYLELLRVLNRKELAGLSTRYERELLQQVESILRDLDAGTAQWVEEAFGKVYGAGSALALDQLKRIGYTSTGKVLVATFSAVNQEMVQNLALGFMGDLAAKTHYLRESVKQMLRDVARVRLTVGQIQGLTSKDIAKRLAETLNEKGWTRFLDERGRAIRLREYKSLVDAQGRIGGKVWQGFVDSAGRRWDIDVYADMVARTKLQEAASQGQQDRLTANGLDLVMVDDHGAIDWCSFYEGKVFSISGKDAEFPALSRTPNGGPPFHPRCKHVLLPVVRGLTPDERLAKGHIADKYLDKTGKELAATEPQKEARA